MTFNAVMAVILRYFCEFVYDVVVKQLARFTNLLLIVYDHINTICMPVRLSSVCLTVTLVHQAVVIFGNISTAFGTLSIC